MTTDLSDRLSALRPAPQFPPLERQAMLDTILNTDRAVTEPLTAIAARSPRRRRLLAGAAAVGLAAAVAIVVPALVPSRTPGGATPAAAAELRRLAVITTHHRSATLGPGQYWYVDQTLNQTGDARDLFGDPNSRRVTLTARYLSWTDQHGNLWRQEQSTDANGKPGVSTDYFPAHANSDESPDFLASLPTVADNLRDYLRAHATGSDSVDEAVFVAIEPILQGGIASAQLRTAAVQVLAETDHVGLTRNARTSTGLSAERFDFIDQTNRPDTIQSIYFDPKSAQVLETSTTAPNSTSVEIVHQTHVTDSVPTAIRKTAVRQK
jgi:hypothetical protein